MSLDTIAVLDVASPLEPNALLERLAGEPALAALAARWGDVWTATEWSAQPGAADARGIDLVGPGGVVLRLGRRSVEVYHVLPFAAFGSEEGDRRVVRRAVRAIARLVGSKRAVYTHELAHTDRDPDEGTDVVIASLTQNAGPPAASFEALAAAKPYRDGSWLVDTFADLDAN